jgi:hypothetical protein
MRSVVTGLMMLVGAVVRDKGHGIDDFGWRRQVQEAQQAREAQEAAARSVTAGDGEAVVVAGPPIGTFGPSRGALMSVAGTEAADAAPGDWDVACEREAGDRLVFDRSSLREMGGATLFRWAPTGSVVPSSDDTIYTAVADCRAKSIEATWPGKRSETRAGTCGRHLVDAVCAARSAGKVPKQMPDRLGRARGGAPNASATP